nr:hypothetical protein [Tanacetum cinerariifolium]
AKIPYKGVFVHDLCDPWSANRIEGLCHVGLGHRVTWGVGERGWYCSGEDCELEKCRELMKSVSETQQKVLKKISFIAKLRRHLMLSGCSSGEVVMVMYLKDKYCLWVEDIKGAREHNKEKKTDLHHMPKAQVPEEKGGGLDECTKILPPIPYDDVSDEPLIIKADVEGYLVWRVFVDQGAVVQVMFEHCFRNLCPTIQARLTQTHTELVGFSGEHLLPIGKIELEIRAISSTTYAMMKFPTLRGIATLVPRMAAIFECRQLKGQQVLPEEQPKKGMVKGGESSTEEDVMINSAFPDQKPADMFGVPRWISQHSLNVNPSITLVAQKQRVLGPEKSKAVMKEVRECIKAIIVRLKRYPTWISDPVLVKKVDDTWRMCMDFKNLNSACPKDYYPLPEIDLKIEAVMGFPFKCFLDAYKGYHQIQMSKEDEQKMALYTDQGTYCCTKNSIQFEKCRGNLSETGRFDLSNIIKNEFRGVCRRYGH